MVEVVALLLLLLLLLAGKTTMNANEDRTTFALSMSGLTAKLK